MLYTVGHRESYEQYFREQDAPMKVGRCPHPQWAGKGDYPGGSVYLSLAEAEAACPPDYSAYGLSTTLGNTYLLGKDRHLIDSAMLVKLP